MATRATVSKRKDNAKSGENFKVALRVRPLIAREILSNATQVNCIMFLSLALVYASLVNNTVCGG